MQKYGDQFTLIIIFERIIISLLLSTKQIC